MAIVYKDCTATDADLIYTCDPCNTTEGGGVRSFCFVKKGTAIATPLNLSAWTAAVQAGDIIILAATRGTYDGGTPKMGTGFGNRKEKLLGHDYVMQVKAPTYAENAEFMAAVENIEDWNLAFATETQMHIVSSDVTVTTKGAVEEGIDTEVLWNIEAKWFSKTKPVITPLAPISTLLKCFEVTA